MPVKSDKTGIIAELVRTLVSGLDRRQRDVLEKRYGLAGGEMLTLAAVGKQYGITRERVRQIESLALSEVRSKLAKEPAAVRFLSAVDAYLKRSGRVSREDLLFEELRKGFDERSASTEFTAVARFVLEASGRFGYGREDEEWYPHWYLDRADQKKMKTFALQVAKAFRGEKQAVIEEKRHNDIVTAVSRSQEVSESVARQHLAISKNFVINQFSDFGLAEWPEVNPRTARDWAYLILKKEQKPLHFVELASKISQFRADKKTNAQTVHNELIKDERFVLVGRGIYGLREFNLLPGTAREVIVHFLKGNGPLKANDVVKLVLEKRLFKEGTLLINLQNKKYFKRLPDGRYTVNEA